jgi:Outer membrane protein beta-barrel domain
METIHSKLFHAGLLIKMRANQLIISSPLVRLNHTSGSNMNRILVAGLLLITSAVPAFAWDIPLYAGVQFDSTTITGLLGYQINKNWAAEIHSYKQVTTIKQAGATNETQIQASGISALYMVPMKLNGGSPYSLFGKVGYERTTQDVTYSFPSSVTYSGRYTNKTNRSRYGGGVQYDFYEHLSGRAGVDLLGEDQSVYLSLILQF